jgi:hypothetical protein
MTEKTIVGKCLASYDRFPQASERGVEMVILVAAYHSMVYFIEEDLTGFAVWVGWCTVKKFAFESITHYVVEIF